MEALYETTDWIAFVSFCKHGRKTVSNSSEEKLHSVLASLEDCRAALVESDSRETAQLVSVAILELRMKLNRIADSELKVLCDAMLPGDAPAARSQESNLRQGRPGRPLLKLVK